MTIAAVLRGKGSNVETITSDARLFDAVGRLGEKRIGALLVVEDGRIAGIISERDLLTKAAGLQASYDTLPVYDIMTATPETVTDEDTLAFAVHKMDIGGYRHLPVLTEGKPTGVISIRDLMRHITQLCKEV